MCKPLVATPGKLKQENSEFKVSLGYVQDMLQNKNKKILRPITHFSKQADLTLWHLLYFACHAGN